MVSDVFSFYGSELASHAAMLVGFVVALFALIQVRDSLSSNVFVALAWVLASSVMYSVVRVVYYGGLCSALMNCSVDEYESWLTDENKPERLRFLVHGRVSNFASDWILKNMKVRGFVWRRVYWKISKKWWLPVQIPLLLSLGIAGLLVFLILVV